MWTKLVLLTVFAFGKASATELHCGGTQSISKGDSFTFPGSCKKHTMVTFNAARTESVLFRDIQFINSTNVSDDANLTITVTEEYNSLLTMSKNFRPIMICDAAGAQACLDRASVMSVAKILFEPAVPANTAEGYGVAFVVEFKKTSDVVGFKDCRCLGVTAGDGRSGMVNLPVDSNMTLSSLKSPCLGTTCSVMVTTNATASYLNLDYNNIGSIMSEKHVPATLYGYMYDPVINQTVYTPQLYANSSYNMTAMRGYSPMFQITLDVPYMSYANFNSSGLMPQDQSSLNVMTPMLPETLKLMPVTLSKKNSKYILKSPSGMYDFSNIQYTWEIDVSLVNKDTEKYTIQWQQNSCAGLARNNSITIKSSGAHMKTVDTCTTMKVAKMIDTASRKITVVYEREDQPLKTGDWMFTFSIKTAQTGASSMTMASMVTLAFASAIALLH